MNGPVGFGLAPMKTEDAYYQRWDDDLGVWRDPTPKEIADTDAYEQAKELYFGSFRGRLGRFVYKVSVAWRDLWGMNDGL